MKAKLTLISAALFAVAACEEQGPFERAGEEIDEAVEDIRAGGETPANQADDAVDELRQGVEDAAEEVEDAVDEARQ